VIEWEALPKDVVEKDADADLTITSAILAEVLPAKFPPPP
jgi:hypothetical protein